MGQNTSNYCLAHNCGKCCELFVLRVTENDLKRWETNRPDILREVIIENNNGKLKKILRKEPVIEPNGKLRNVCVFYDPNKNCLIYDVRPENCRKFSCTKHIFFIFQLFNETSRFLKGQKVI